MGENSYAMPAEPLSPELALVDPELGARARSMLPESVPVPRRPQLERRDTRDRSDAPAVASRATARYPVWARMTAALWLVVLGILIGGTAIPHAQDKPRVVPASEDATICEPAETPTRPAPSRPGQPSQDRRAARPRYNRPARGYSSVGRAPGSHPGGRRFESA